MTEVQLKSRIGIFLIMSHFFLILLIMILYLFGGFLFEEVTTTIALIFPMFSIYTTAIIKNIIANRTQRQTWSKDVTRDYIFITFFIPSIFIVFLISIIFIKVFNITTFEQFKIMLGVSETVFGTYVGLVLSSMFDVKHSQGDKDEQNLPKDKS
jgi:hypothetical protein